MVCIRSIYKSNGWFQVSSKQIKFNYQPQTHLHATLIITNHSQHHAYFKFKVTRPKYYLIKPQHGFCNAHTSITISILLHQEAANQGECHKIKLYYKPVGKEHIQPTRGWETQQSQSGMIEGLPEQFKKQEEKASNEVRSLSNSKYDVFAVSSSNITDRESRVSELQEEINQLKISSSTATVAPTSQDITECIVVGAVGLLIGFIASIYL